MTTNLNVLKEACAQLLGFNDFWVLGALTDHNFEEGNRSSDIKWVIETYEQAEMPEEPISQLRTGVNGVLAQLLERNNTWIRLTRNKWKGQDLLWGPPEAKAEIKLVHDCILGKYYDSVARDYSAKLCGERSAGFSGDLFLIVYFVQLPRYRYPIRSPHGTRAVKFVGIETQFAQLHSLPPPEWRAEPQALRPPGNNVANALERRFRTVHRRPNSWRFDLAAALKDAAVTVAVWQVP